MPAAAATTAVPQFSIHQDLWHDCWVAATATARSKKKQVEFNIEQRVRKMLEDYGPQSGMPLTLRVYGTMLKGFCVINNERARGLHADCERLVFAFSQHQALGDESKALKLAPTKRKHVDALTLDLDLRKVQESEAFDWAPLEAGALLQLPTQSDGVLAVPSQHLEATQQPQQSSLLAQVDLLDESFPAIDAPPTEPIDMTSTAMVPVPPLEQLQAGAAAAAAAVAAMGDAGPEDMELDDPLPLVPKYPASPGTAAAAATAAAALGQDGELSASDLAALVAAHVAVQARGRKLFKPLEPGRVFGFDEQTTLPAAMWEAWRRDDADITVSLSGPAAYAELIPRKVAGRFGPLSPLLELPASASRSGPRRSTELAALAAAPSSTGAVAPALAAAGDGGDHDAGHVNTFGCQDAANPPASHPRSGAANSVAPLPFTAIQADPFRPCDPLSPLSGAKGAGDEIAGMLAANPPGAGEEGSQQQPSRKRKHGRASVLPYDEQTAQVGDVFRRYITASAGEDRGITLDDLVPPSKTDQVTAAKTFHALLALATAGEFHVEQLAPYVPISISVA